MKQRIYITQAISSFLLFYQATSFPTQAQITPDTTLGSESSTVQPNVNINGAPGNLITGGARREGNLFHSFSDFNVNNNQRVFFDNPSGVINILSRVTGINPSRILGTLGVTGGDANLFLINPNGVIFGQNARLDLRGSFLATTANAINFTDGTQFKADPLQSVPLLTVTAPIGLQFGPTPGAIAVSGLGETLSKLLKVGLGVETGKTLALVGGNLTLKGGFLKAPNGRIELGGLVEPGVVGLSDSLRLSFPPGIERGNVSVGANQPQGLPTVVHTVIGGANNASNITIHARIFSLKDQSLIESSTNTQQNGGDITIDAGSVQLSGRAKLNSSTSGSGNAGETKIVAQNSVLLEGGSEIISRTQGQGNAGDITVEAGSISITDKSGLISSSNGSGNAGSIFLQIRDATSLSDSLINSSAGVVIGQGFGDAGDIHIRTGTLTLTKGAGFFVANAGEKKAGNVKINARDRVLLDKSYIYGPNPGTAGVSGNVEIDAKSIVLTDSAIIVATFGEKDAGNVRLKASDSTVISRVDPNLEQLKQIGLSTPGIYTNTTGKGNAGSLTIETGDLKVLGGAQVSASTRSSGKGGTLSVTSNSLDVMSGGQLRTTTSGSGNAGDITADVRDRITLSGSGSGLFVNTTGSGNAGNLNLKTQNLSISDGAQISASTSAQGVGGSVTVNTQDLFVNNARISATTSGEGAGGSITVTTNTLEATNGGKLITDASQAGRAGDIIANVRDRITLSGNGTQISASTSGRGDAGNVSLLNTQNLSVSVRDGAQISAETSGQGKGGNILVRARSFEANTGGQLRTTTLVSGDAGSITTTIEDKILLAGSRSGMFANTEPGSSGKGGNITIDPQTVIIRDGARVAVDSQGSRAGGNIKIQAENLTLDNQGQISSKTASTNGGDIDLQVGKVLLLRRGSQISTTAGNDQAGGDGGNIRIDALFVVALPNENSDITANAFTGRGGRVDITTRGIFGIAPAVRLTPLSDVTASSQFGISGVVTINTPDIDPSKGLVQLPSTPVDPSNQIRQTCRPAGTQQASSFVVTGRGGIPISPERTIQQTPLTRWVTANGGDRGQQASESSGVSQKIQNPKSEIQNSPIVEAQGWMKDAQGTVWLVSNAPAISGKAGWGGAPTCP